MIKPPFRIQLLITIVTEPASFVEQPLQLETSVASVYPCCLTRKKEGEYGDSRPQRRLYFVAGVA